jgi:hypothetical protein
MQRDLWPSLSSGRAIANRQKIVAALFHATILDVWRSPLELVVILSFMPGGIQKDRKSYFSHICCSIGESMVAFGRTSRRMADRLFSFDSFH